ncbi:MAG: hypothetical protein AAFQ63_21930 [Cyanobacteria bacterium J06621_11]
MAVGTATQNKWERRLKMNGELWMGWRDHKQARQQVKQRAEKR